ncbi:MAG TPA: hypothetical protein VHB69_04025 [Mycobacteriales bacterium]|nr:hypothetical protein [Mycobacteriales bacterium]
MYAWIWRKLPGGLAGKLLGVAVLVAAVVVLLFLVVFPWASPKLPFNHVTVDSTTRPQPTSTAPAVPN